MPEGTVKFFCPNALTSPLKSKKHIRIKIKCTIGQKKKKNFIYFNTNYRTEMKLVPIIMD